MRYDADEKDLMHWNPNVDVDVYEDGHFVAGLSPRPVRLMPNGNAGVVYDDGLSIARRKHHRAERQSCKQG